MPIGADRAVDKYYSTLANPAVEIQVTLVAVFIVGVHLLIFNIQMQNVVSLYSWNQPIPGKH